MRKFGIGLAIAIASVGAARAADLPTKKAVAAAPVNCFASVWTWLDSTAADCPLSWGPFTVYGTVDVGVGYESNGAPYTAAWNNGVNSFVTKQSYGAKWLWTPNGLSQSVAGIKMSQSLAPTWATRLVADRHGRDRVQPLLRLSRRRPALAGPEQWQSAAATGSQRRFEPHRAVG